MGYVLCKQWGFRAGGTSKEVEKSYDVTREDSYHIASYVEKLLLWTFTAVALELLAVVAWHCLIWYIIYSWSIYRI